MAENQENRGRITEDGVLSVLNDVIDPEVYLGIVDLGLVYRIEILDDRIEVDFTLTAPGCPAAEDIEREITEKVEAFAGLPVKAKVVWRPPWRPEFMSDEAKVSLGYPI